MVSALTRALETARAPDAIETRAALVDAARAGSGRALVVRGVAGSGKSALLADAVAAAPDMRVLRTSGVGVNE